MRERKALARELCLNRKQRAVPGSPANRKGSRGFWSVEHDPADVVERRRKLVLMDLKLPSVDGLEVLRRLKADPRTRTIPVVILTSSKEERDLITGYGLGANSYIQKPVDFERFRETVKSLGLHWLLINQAPVRKPVRQAATKS
jgi:CheY-like chemotaxis protein